MLDLDEKKMRDMCADLNKQLLERIEKRIENNEEIPEDPEIEYSISLSPSLECQESLRISQVIEKLELLKNLHGDLHLLVNGYNKYGNLKPVTSIELFTIQDENGYEDNIYID